MKLIKKTIHEQFPIKDKGPITIFLNMYFKRNRIKREIYLSQPLKIEKLLSNDKYNERDYTQVRTPTKVPANPDVQLFSEMCANTPEMQAIMKKKPYKSILGQVLFIMITCRPDIATAVSKCGQFAQNPGIEHWKALLQIVAYLNSTKDMCFKLGGITKEIILNAYSDSDWGGDLDKRRSRTGFVIRLNDSPVTWMSKLQTSIALSSTESEYVALSLCARDIIWCRYLLEQMGFTQRQPTTIYEDNLSCIKIAESHKLPPGTKHVEIKYHFIRDKIESKEIILKYETTHEMLADILTKALPFMKFRKHRNTLGVEDT